MYIEQKGDVLSRHRIWWCFGEEIKNSGYCEQFEFNPRILRNKYCAIFLHEKAKLLMIDYANLPENVNNHTLYLDGTIIVIEGELKVYFGAATLRNPIINLSAIMDKSLDPILRNLAQRLIFLSAVEPMDLSAVWVLTMDKQGGRGRKSRFAYLEIPKNEEKYLKRISVMKWNDGVKYARYYQSKRDWTQNIVLADNNSSFAVPYSGCAEPENRPVCIVGPRFSNLV